MTNSKPIVSVILPTYNVAPWLEDCIQSLQAQTIENWEAIFVLDGATDNSGAIIESYACNDNRIRLMPQENKGQGCARNYGVSCALGEYLFFLDPDDAISPNALESVVNVANETGADIVIGDYFPFYDGELTEWNDRPASEIFRKQFSTLPSIFNREDIKDDELFYHSLYFMVVWMKLFRASVWKENDIKAPVGISMGEDFMTVKKMCFITGRIATVDKIIIYYRKRLGSSTTLRSRKAFGIFDSYQYTSAMYQDMNLSRRENTLMHKAYLAWFFFHMIKFTPYRLWPEFYNETCRCVSRWPLADLDHEYLRPSEVKAIVLLRRQHPLYFPLYVFVMLRMDNIIKSCMVKLLRFLNKILPSIIVVVLAKIIDFLVKRVHSSTVRSLLEKSKTHLLGGDSKI